jgi:flagellar basal-body rod protein FlgG
MLRAVHTAATGMEAMQTNLDNISNNIANVNTTAYKQSTATFHDLLYQNIREPGGQAGPDTVQPTGVQVGAGVRTASVHKNFEPGPLKITNREFDVAINGDGFFPVETDNGETVYTRDGNFQKLPDGRITTVHGHILQPTITIPQGTVGFGISPKGVVSVTDSAGKRQDIGQIQLVNFVNPSGLKALGGNLYQISDASGTPLQGNPGESNFGPVQQGALEGSNVNIVTEMVNMIQAQRAYEMNSKAISAADTMMGTTTNVLR